MAYLIVRDVDGKDILTRELSADDVKTHYAAWMSATLVSFDGKQYRLHSVARTRPERNLVLCVSFEGYDPMAYCDC